MPLTGIALIVATTSPGSALCQEPHWPVRAVVKPGVITTGQDITPAGTQSVFSGRVHDVAIGRTDHLIYVALSSGDVYKLDCAANKVLEIDHSGRKPGMQGDATAHKVAVEDFGEYVPVPHREMNAKRKRRGNDGQLWNTLFWKASDCSTLNSTLKPMKRLKPSGCARRANRRLSCTG